MAASFVSCVPSSFSVVSPSALQRLMAITPPDMSHKEVICVLFSEQPVCELTGVDKPPADFGLALEAKRLEIRYGQAVHATGSSAARDGLVRRSRRARRTTCARRAGQWPRARAVLAVAAYM